MHKLSKLKLILFDVQHKGFVEFKLYSILREKWNRLPSTYLGSKDEQLI